MQAYLLGHTLKRIGMGAGVYFWTADDGHERFDTMNEAADWVRSQPRWRPECRDIHQPRCTGHRRTGHLRQTRRPSVPQTVTTKPPIPVLV